MRIATVFVLGGFALAFGSAHAQEGDASAGEQVFRKCQACHVVDEEKNRVGPHLVNIIGRQAGAVEDYRYSDAMMESGLVWDEATLDQYLADPKGVVKGTKMAFAGLKDEEDRRNVIAYLKSASSQ